MKYEISEYPDGAKYVKVLQYDRDVLFRLNSYEDLWLLNQLVSIYNDAGLVPTVTIPNLIDAQADRKFEDNQPSGLKLVCQFLNNMSANFRIFHPHNPEVVEALIDNVEIIDNKEFVIKVIDSILTERVKNATTFEKYKELHKIPGGNLYKNFHNNVVLMSSDAGGFKPLMKLCDKIGWEGETYSASKSRSYKQGESKLTQLIDRNDFEGKDILIIDDISVYGGTFKGLSKLLREKNCGKLYLAVSHMTVQDLGEDPVTNYFDKVFTTDSKFTTYYKNNLRFTDVRYRESQPKNLEIINLRY